MNYSIIMKDVAGAPPEFQILPEGKIELDGLKPVYLNDAGAERIIKTFKARGNDMVIDYEHQTLDDVEAPAAGWIKKLSWRGKDGLWAAVEWTKKAKDYLESREYRYFSPVIGSTMDGLVVWIHSAALTNSPKINNLKPIMAKLEYSSGQNNKEAIMFEKLKKLLGLPTEAGEEKVPEAVEALQAKLKAFTGALGVTESASTDDVTAAVAALKKTDVVACKEVMAAIGVDDAASKDSAVAAIEILKKTNDKGGDVKLILALSDKLANVEKELAGIKSENIIDMALKSGKTSPEELDSWGRDLAAKSPDQFKKIVLSRQAGSVIPLDKIHIAKGKSPGGVPDETQREINKQMGISDETYAKFGPKAVD